MKKKQIVFIEPYQTVMVYKIAKEFRKKGYETVLIRILEPDKKNESFFDDAYDRIIDMNLTYIKVSKENLVKIGKIMIKKSKNLLSAFKKIFFLKPYVVIGRAPLSIPIMFFRKLFRKYPFIYFPYDIRSQGFETYEDGLKHFPAFEIKADRYCFENSDGILHKGSPDEIAFIEGRMLGKNIKIPKLHLSFQPYCSDEFIVPINKDKVSKDGEIHFVYIGGTGRPTEIFFLEQLELYKNVLDQKIHVHFYFSSDVSFSKNQYEEKEMIKKSFYEKYKDHKHIKYFHLHDSKDPKEIVKEISKYDFGSHFPEFSEIAGYEPKYNTGNKMSTYLEAGIPFFHRYNYEFIGKLMKDYNLQLLYPNDFSDLRKIIKKIDREKLEKNIIKAREDFNIKKQFPKLEKFIHEVVKSKKHKNSI